MVRSDRARRIALKFDALTGRARLVLPRRAALKPAMAWLERHRDWIAAQQAKLPAPRPFVPDAVVPVGGVETRLVWRADAPRTPTLAEGTLTLGGPIERFSARVERWLRREALRVLSEETAHYAATAGVTVSRVSIGDPASRWGSCATSGAIRYSWRLILAPAHVRRATVAHEVAHRLHMDHSPAFHACVARLFEGDATAARRWLKANGAALHWYGRAAS